MIVRLITEEKNIAGIKRLCSAYFDGYTLYKGLGLWKGQEEPSLTIEVAFLPQTERPEDDKIEFHKNVYRLARDIKEANAQQAVLIECIESLNLLV
jgi:hypothetical protein